MERSTEPKFTARRVGKSVPAHVITATFPDGTVVEKRTTKSYPFIVVGAVCDGYSGPEVWVVKGTADRKVAERARRDRYGTPVAGRAIMAMTADGYVAEVR